MSKVADTKNTLQQKERLSRLALLLLGILWGSTFVVVSSTKEYFKPSLLIALRFSIGLLFLALCFFKRFKALSKAYFLPSLIVGITTFFGYYTQAYAMTELNGKPGRVAFLVATYCVIVPFVSWAINKRRPDIFNIIAAFLCVTGIALISLPDLIASDTKASLADFFALLSSIIFVFNIIFIERMAPKLDTILFTITQFLVVAGFAFLFTFMFEDNSQTIFNTQSTFTLLYLAIPCTAIALALQIFGQKYTKASTASLFFALESVFGISFSLLLGFEQLTLPLFVGGFLIVFSIILSETKLGLKAP